MTSVPAVPDALLVRQGLFQGRANRRLGWFQRRIVRTKRGKLAQPFLAVSELVLAEPIAPGGRGQRIGTLRGHVDARAAKGNTGELGVRGSVFAVFYAGLQVDAEAEGDRAAADDGERHASSRREAACTPR